MVGKKSNRLIALCIAVAIMASFFAMPAGAAHASSVYKEVLAPCDPGFRMYWPIGDVMWEIQYQLNLKGYYYGIIDGEGGNLTARAIQSYSRNGGYTGVVDGYFGPNTAKAIQRLAAGAGYAGPIDGDPREHSWRAFLCALKGTRYVYKDVYIELLPAKPTALSATGQNPPSTVVIRWNSVSGATLYEVQYSHDNINWYFDGTTSSNSFTSYGNTLSNIYYFRVRAKNASGLFSGWSDSVRYMKPGVGNPSIIAIGTNRSEGTTSDYYSYYVKTSLPASKLTFHFSGNNTVYTMWPSGYIENCNSGYGAVGDNFTSWMWFNDRLGAGIPRTITIKAYNSAGQVTSTSSMNIIVRP